MASSDVKTRISDSPQATVPAPDDNALFALADRYLSALHAGDRRTCADLLGSNPELRRLADCLNVLDEFTPPAAPAALSAADPDATQVVSNPDHPGAPGIDTVSDLPSRDFGRYELLEEIGRGGMGVVYKARQRDLNRTVALKMILANRLADDDDVKRFYREARAVAAGGVRHPHIVGIHDIGQIHGQHFFTMDFVSGKSLAGALRGGPLAPERAARLLIAVARAVQHLHDQGIIHRDLKPSNILLDDQGTPFVTDFGLAKVFQDDEERTQSGVILGTPGYMSPEQAAGRVSEISGKSDVYSLGAILYEMLTGRAPFRDENPLNTILQVLESEPTLPRKINARIPAELERICLRCLEKDAARRYVSAGALADELDRYLRHEPLETKPAGFADRFRRWVRRETGLAARLAILGLAVGIVETQHLLSHRPWDYHLAIKCVFVVWTVLAIVFQRFLRRDKSADLARLAWAVTDPILLMIVLVLAPDNVGILMVGYPLLVTASGLWFSVRLVVVSTVACLASVGTLLVLRLVLRHESLSQPHYPVIFAAALLVIGFMVAFQVHRVRTLSRYFEQTQLPPRS